MLFIAIIKEKDKIINLGYIDGKDKEDVKNKLCNMNLVCEKINIELEKV